MGFLDSGDIPDFNVPASATDMNSASFLNSSLKRQDSGVQGAYDRSRQQLNSDSGLMPTVQNYQRQDASLGMQTNQAQLNAIHTKGENLFSRNVQKMAMDNQLNEYKDRSAKLAQDFSLSAKQTQIFETIKQGRLQAERARIASRNAVLGNVFGAIGAIVGAVAGTYAGGNTALGAMAGAQAGKAMAGGDGGGGGGGSAGDVMATLNQGGPRSGRNEAGNGMGDFGDRMRGTGSNI